MDEQGKRWMESHLGPLVGHKITKLIFDGDETWGFEIDNGARAWILRDEEGNGPGFLDIEKPEKGKKEKQ